ncbi:MAG: hypothetical protein A3F13_03510 [Gammaproteobacteria bacterium RIFCSPHIGHO2_12_FULL_40_19]|nr:MAG: hypothetical protein A3F13_03510 [Gammaproteobacteria bacterium RIFCSPHIGHO2_12_FULL_40_19]
MTRIEGLNITEYQWNDVRNDVCNVNAHLAEIIDALNPSAEYKIFEANYNYGDLVLDEGMLMLPTSDGRCVSLEDSTIPETLKKSLSYSSAPIGLIMSNTIEVFIESGFDVIPLVVLGPGRTLGLLETIDPVGGYCLRHIWSSCAGARSVYMLPKISDKISHTRLQREFGFTLEAPKNYCDHFKIFREISRAPHFSKKQWKLKILFFSEKWLEFDPFKQYLKNAVVQNSSYARNKTTFDVLWHFFSKELTEKSSKPNPYVLDTLKHVVKILIGATPGYAPVCNDESRGPLSAIQKIYLDVYRLNSVPTIMAPYHFVIDDEKSFPVIHSMNNPNMFETNPKMRESESLITDLVQTESLFRHFYDLGKNGKLKIRQTILEKVFEQTNLIYYHANPGNNYSGVKLSSELPDADNKFMSYPYPNQSNNLKFADNGEFVKSCILIKKR